MDRDGVEVHKQTKKDRVQYPAISEPKKLVLIKDLLVIVPITQGFIQRWTKILLSQTKRSY